MRAPIAVVAASLLFAVAPAMAAGENAPAAVGAPAQAAAKKKPKKVGCLALKTKKAQSSCKAKRRSGKYRKGQVCSLDKKMMTVYMRYGFFCIDISAYQDGSLTYLEELGK